MQLLCNYIFKGEQILIIQEGGNLLKPPASKCFALIGFVLFILLSTTQNVSAVEPAFLRTTVEAGFGITATIVNEGEMTASNITIFCMELSQRTDRDKYIIKQIPEMAQNDEITIHFFAFFLGKIYYGAGPSSYFDGVENQFFDTPLFEGFAIGPFIINQEN